MNTKTIEALIKQEKIACMWFAMCDKPATHLEPHPILELVPACDRCVKIGA